MQHGFTGIRWRDETEAVYEMNHGNGIFESQESLYSMMGDGPSTSMMDGEMLHPSAGHSPGNPNCKGPFRM